MQIKAQNNLDANRIVLNTIVIDKENTIPEEAENQLKIKLEQLTANNGIGGNSINPRFVIAARINLLSKDVIAGPPQMIAVNADIILFVGDAVDNQLFSSTSISAKGVGTNENKAIINAIQQISLKDKNIIELLNTGKVNIANYYLQKCDFIIQKSKTLSQQQKYGEAIYELMQVPEVCKSCYEKCMTSIQPIFQAKIDKESIVCLNKAKNTWNANPNSKGAEEVANLLSNIAPSSAAYKEALSFSEVVRKKIETDEKRDWEFSFQKYKDGVKLEEQRLEALKQVAIAYYQSQPQTIIYSRVIW
jgi:hypothetical protein